MRQPKIILAICVLLTQSLRDGVFGGGFLGLVMVLLGQCGSYFSEVGGVHNGVHRRTTACICFMNF